MAKKTLCGLTADEIFHFIEPTGHTLKHAVLISDGIYKKRISAIPRIPKISKKLIGILVNFADTGIFQPADTLISADGTIKYLFRTENGLEYETVYIPDKKRNTVCVSTQSGCRMGCRFCATGRSGFRGNLSAGEMLNQIISLPGAGNVTHVVFMGMGEPMDNLEEVLKTCEILSASWGMAISQRNITVSSVGITNGIRRFLEGSACNLTVSLHSPFAGERELIIPAEKNNPVHGIVESMKSTPLRKYRRLSMAYMMINAFNDTDHHLDELIQLLKGSGIRVNLIPYHPVPFDTMASSPAARMQYFKHNLVMNGISASIRKSRGFDISAACGHLAAGSKEQRKI